jgi:hypothetical protein
MAVSSLTHSSNSFRVLLYVYFNIHDSKIATAAEYLVILAENTCWDIERK